MAWSGYYFEISNRLSTTTGEPEWLITYLGSGVVPFSRVASTSVTINQNTPLTVSSPFTVKKSAYKYLAVPVALKKAGTCSEFDWNH